MDIIHFNLEFGGDGFRRDFARKNVALQIGGSGEISRQALQAEAQYRNVEFIFRQQVLNFTQCPRQKFSRFPGTGVPSLTGRIEVGWPGTRFGSITSRETWQSTAGASSSLATVRATSAAPTSQPM